MSKKKVESLKTRLDKKQRIPAELTQIQGKSYDDDKGRIGFSKVCDRRCKLEEWQGKELSILLDCFQKIEKLTWKEIIQDNGLHYEPHVKHTAYRTPDTFPEDTSLASLRVDSKKRIYGFRAQDTFYVIWFDKNHEVCPLNKSKRSAI